MKLRAKAKNVSMGRRKLAMLVYKPVEGIERKTEFQDGDTLIVWRTPEYLVELESEVYAESGETISIEWDWPFPDHKPTEMRFHPVPESVKCWLLLAFTYGDDDTPILREPGSF